MTTIAPTVPLLERARLAAEEIQRETNAINRQNWADARKRDTEALIKAMAESLDETIAAEDVSYDENSHRVSVIVDGRAFAIVDHGNYDYPREALSVDVRCARGCGVPLWVVIEYGGLARLHEVLLDTNETHRYDCILVERPRVLDAYEKAHAAATTITEAGARVATAYGVVQFLEDNRPLIKAKCIEAMIGTPNPLGKPGAVHSASSAEAVVEQHADYWQHRRDQEAAEVERWNALAGFDAAKLIARLEVERYAADERRSE